MMDLTLSYFTLFTCPVFLQRSPSQAHSFCSRRTIAIIWFIFTFIWSTYHATHLWLYGWFTHLHSVGGPLDLYLWNRILGYAINAGWSFAVKMYIMKALFSKQSAPPVYRTLNQLLDY